VLRTLVEEDRRVRFAHAPIRLIACLDPLVCVRRDVHLDTACSTQRGRKTRE